MIRRTYPRAKSSHQLKQVMNEINPAIGVSFSGIQVG